ncbi:unsaturated rhamnogalacturonyl hydrolase [Phycicoccus badiiscoriae]|uniref:Unsaturated rhamnogalacturonyl hydrolase n=1 Tax=Pedococcus badiiscoriae TaxID=642776 RepID=A0A852WR22_9MICO|nr:glycoside hydrolase family 88 protein [Pedococcus badiiscoriae]NYG08655.1 unsaturated rhamnogalacturonyl hydrolase [Pedococcus badiiscoriae]
MAGRDLTSSRFAAPPLPPLTGEALNDDALRTLGRQIEDKTWRDGLPDFFWGEGVCLLGMIRFAEATHDPFPPRVREWLDERARGDLVIDHVNHLAAGTAAVLDGTPSSSALAERLLAWLQTSSEVTYAANGAIEHWPDGVWADSVFMGGLFVGHLGEARGDASLVRELGRQWLAHAEILQDEGTRLFVHGSHAGRPIRCFWGRANAWMALGAVEFLELAERRPDLVDQHAVEDVRTRLARQLEALAACQPDHGVWSVLVDDQPENAGILETSAAAGLGAAMLRASRVIPGLPDAVVAAGWRAVAGALAYVEDGTLTRVSAGTVLQLVPFGYSVIRDDRPQLWGQGLALHAVAAALAARQDTPATLTPRHSSEARR